MSRPRDGRLLVLDLGKGDQGLWSPGKGLFFRLLSRGVGTVSASTITRAIRLPDEPEGAIGHVNGGRGKAHIGYKMG